jgi:hypothetical protein
MPFDPDTFDYHDACLRSENPEPPVDVPQTGFYRLAIKVDNVVQRVGTFFYYEEVLGKPQLGWRIGRNNEFTESEARAKWNFCARSAITRSAYEQWWQTGTWSDVDVAASQAIGANQAANETLFEKLKRTLTDLWQISDYATITDDEHEKRAKTRVQALRSEFNIANTARKEEKDPHLEASRVVDARWSQLLVPTSDAVESIQRAIVVYEKKLAAALKAEEAKRLQANPTYQQPEAPARKVKGGLGRGATVKSFKRAVVRDIGTVATYFKDNEKLVELLTTLAQRAHIQGVVVPGVELVDDIKLTN